MLCNWCDSPATHHIKDARTDYTDHACNKHHDEYFGLSKMWYDVKVHFPAEGTLPGDTHYDAIRGRNPQDAIRMAKWNWPAADHIELIDSPPDEL